MGAMKKYTRAEGPIVPPPGWQNLEALVRRRRVLVTQGEFAPAIGLDVSALSRLERGRVPRVSKEMLARYRCALERVERALDKETK